MTMIQEIIRKIICYFAKTKQSTEAITEKFVANTVESPIDDRDFIYVGGDLNLPKKVRLITPPIRSQGATNSCMSHASVRAQEIQLMQEGRYLEGNELYHYYNARKDAGTFPDKVGMSVRQGCATAVKHGMALEKAWPWNPNNVNITPPLSAYWLSSLYPNKTYWRVTSIQGIKSALDNGLPIQCGIWVDLHYYNLDSTTYVWSPIIKTTKYGGHAQVIVGYDDETQQLEIENSWGRSWGKKGTYFIDYDKFEKISFDWYITLTEKW